MAENFHLLGFVTVAVSYPPGTLSAKNIKLVDGKLAENKEGTMIFHQGGLGAYLRPVKGTITFKRDSEKKTEDRMEHDSHWDFKVSPEVNFVPKVGVTAGPTGVGANLEVGGAKAGVGVGYNNQDVTNIHKDFAKDDKGYISVMGFEAGIPQLGKITCRTWWKKNELDLVLDKSYDGDCQFNVSIRF